MSNHESSESRLSKCKNLVKKAMGTFAVGIALSSLTACGNNETTEASNDKPVATATAELDKQSAEKPGSKEGQVGVEGLTYETANTAKAKEFVEDAYEPIPTSRSEEDAIVEWGRKNNIYLLSGTVTSSLDETVESKREGETILSATLEDSGTVSDGWRNNRQAISAALYYVNEILAIPGETGTYKRSYKPLYRRNDGWWVVEVSVETNLYSLDPTTFSDDKENLTNTTFTTLVKPTKLTDGTYVMSQATDN